MNSNIESDYPMSKSFWQKNRMITYILFDLPTLTSLIKGHAHLFFSRKKSSLPSDFLSYPFIIAYPFIREVRVCLFKHLSLAQIFVISLYNGLYIVES